MTCYHPGFGWKNEVVRERLSFGEPVCEPGDFTRVSIPCGKCRGCLEDDAREWSIRLMHEAQLWPVNSFVTLTYDDAHLPPGKTLVKRDFQLFMKRLRKHFEPARIRYFGVGEYGPRTKRPHYHICLFNCFFADRKPCGKSKSGFLMYDSAVLNSLWPYAQLNTVQDMTQETAQYCARYCLKKLGPKDSYRRLDPVTLEWYSVAEEFHLMSRRKGIGADWFEQFHADIYSVDRDQAVRPDGSVVKPPAYYDRILRTWCEDDYLAVKQRRAVEALPRLRECQPDRLAVREQVAAARDALSPRDAF